MKNDVVRLTTDEYLIPKEIHEECASLLNESGLEIEEERGDTRAIGGSFWHPSDFIIFIGGQLFGTVFSYLAGKGFGKLVSIYKNIQPQSKDVHYPHPSFLIATNISDEMEVYFDLDCFNYEKEEYISDDDVISKALAQIPDTVSEIKMLINEQGSALLGEPRSCIMKYDFPTSRWIVREFNSDASIFWDEVYRARHRKH